MGSATGGAMTLAGAILVTVVVKTPVAWTDVARDMPTGGVSGFDGHRADDDGAHGSVAEPLSCPRRGDGKTGDDRDWGGENGFHDHDLLDGELCEVLVFNVGIDFQQHKSLRAE
jgi:hypothetical protein